MPSEDEVDAWSSSSSEDEDSDDGLMNEHLGVSEYEHGCEHGDWAW